MKRLTTYSDKISVSARSSPLSRAQVQEILQEIQVFYPNIYFQVTFVKTKGDLDKKTSLRTLEKTDFFTREVDERVIFGKSRIAIHSAKDLPEPLAKSLKVIALTKGVDSSDSLVLRENETLFEGALVATSSERREKAVKKMGNFIFEDLRGTIQERLTLLFDHKVDAVVIAEAALIRLKLTHLNRVKIPGKTVPLQGKLAVVAKKEDIEMEQFFAQIDARY